jgi:hypothetical protein
MRRLLGESLQLMNRRPWDSPSSPFLLPPILFGFALHSRLQEHVPVMLAVADTLERCAPVCVAAKLNELYNNYWKQWADLAVKAVADLQDFINEAPKAEQASDVEASGIPGGDAQADESATPEATETSPRDEDGTPYEPLG